MESIIGLVLAVVFAFFFGSRYAKSKDHEDQSKRNADAHVKARKAQDEMDGRDDIGVAGWLRKRSGK